MQENFVYNYNVASTDSLIELVQHIPAEAFKELLIQRLKGNVTNNEYGFISHVCCDYLEQEFSNEI